MKTHPYADGAALGPCVLGDRSLRFHRGGDRVDGHLEHNEEGVALGTELGARVGDEAIHAIRGGIALFKR